MNAPLACRAIPPAPPGRCGAAEAAAEWESAVVLAFLLAPAAGTLALDLLFAASAALDGTLPWQLLVVAPIFVAPFGAYPIAIVVGIPAYILVRDLRVDLAGATFTGALTAAAPFLLDILVNGTASGGEAAFDGAVALSGAVAGAVFWALTFRRWPSRPRRPPTLQPASPEAVAAAAEAAVAAAVAEPWRLSS